MADARDADVVPPSCVGLAPTCGPMGMSSCCESPVVPGGFFFRSMDVASDAAYPDTLYPAMVSTFRLDKYEVTVGRLRNFIEAGMGTQSSPPAAGAGGRMLNGATGQGGWDPSWTSRLPVDMPAAIAAMHCYAPHETWSDTPGANESRPVNCIDWYSANAFCVWDGGFLPTEAEWNYAAAGGNEQRAYPWSSPAGSLVIDPSHASYSADLTTCLGDGNPSCDVTDLVVPGSKPLGDGRWGQSDLAGNVWEWVLDAAASPYPMKMCDDCANLVGSGRVTRGSGFEYDQPRTGRRNSNAEDLRNSDWGFRCARPP